MNTNNPAPRRDNDGDNIAAVPIAEKKAFNWLYLTPLLLLLLIPFCSRRETDPAAGRAADAASIPIATPKAVASPAASVAERATGPTRNAAATTLLNPFTVHPTGPDMGKAVLNFDANATTPSTDATGVLRSVADYLQANPAAKVSLKGFTDSSGSAEINRQLTQKRIEVVKGALTGAGVDAGRIATANFGEAYAVTDNSTAQAREMNRRVEIELMK